MSMFTIDEMSKVHKRSVYGLFDLLADAGGYWVVLSVVAGYLLRPISYHNFMVETMSRLYLARTKEESLFPSNEQSPEIA